MRKCLVKRRAFIEPDDLYKWVENKDLVQEALDEAYQYIGSKIKNAKIKIEAMKEIAENYEEKLGDISVDYEKVKIARKRLGRAEFPEEGLP